MIIRKKNKHEPQKDLFQSKSEHKSSDFFEKHLKFPTPLEKSKKPKSGPSTSAISAQAWRSYYIDKAKEKESKEIMKKRKREEAERVKCEKLSKKKKTKSEEEKSDYFEESKLVVITKQICGVCEYELHSDAEEDGEKNVGCDMCPRWFHLDCTTLAGQVYEEVAHQDFYCDFCK